MDAKESEIKGHPGSLKCGGGGGGGAGTVTDFILPPRL